VKTAFGGDLSGIELFEVPTNDAWIRDYGPLFVVRRDSGDDASAGAASLVATCWGYNGWGEKYPPFDADARVSRTIARLLDLASVEPDMLLVGGASDVEGAGTVLAARGSVITPTRNPELDQAEIEARLKSYLGARTIHWLECSLEGDDTDGHVDNSARFVAPGRVATAVEANPRDVNHVSLRRNRERLGGLVDASGRGLEVVELPMPSPVVHQGIRCPASYLNFYIGNTAVLVPTFECPRDAEALGILGELFPGRRIVGIDCRDLVRGLGGLHCITQQQPEVGGRAQRDS
jgi:agmatine deiminase